MIIEKHNNSKADIFKNLKSDVSDINSKNLLHVSVFEQKYFIINFEVYRKEKTDYKYEWIIFL